MLAACWPSVSRSAKSVCSNNRTPSNVPGWVLTSDGSDTNNGDMVPSVIDRSASDGSTKRQSREIDAVALRSSFISQPIDRNHSSHGQAFAASNLPTPGACQEAMVDIVQELPVLAQGQSRSLPCGICTADPCHHASSALPFVGHPDRYSGGYYGPAEPCVLVPLVTITPRRKAIDDPASGIWTAVELSAQYAQPVGLMSGHGPVSPSDWSCRNFKAAPDGELGT